MRLPLSSLVLALGLVACAKDVEPRDTAPPEDTNPLDTEPEWADADADGYTEDVDCDDDNADIHPDATEICDGVDNNCDEAVDEGFDADGDGYLDAESCEGGEDCDDSDSGVHLGATELPYDGIDQDCDGEDLLDVDGDGYDAVEAGGTDCDDSDATVFPGAAEIAKDGIDQDCDGLDLLDADGDGYNDLAEGGEDCDDSDPAVNPDASDYLVDGLDADCDGKDGARFDLDDADVIIAGDTSGATNALLGRGVTVCDLDHDGLDDLVVGAPFGSSYSGQVGVFYGANASTWTSGMAMADADAVITGDTFGFVGFSPGCVDFDGDGYNDLLFQRGEINYGSTYVQQFGLLVYYGNGTQLASSLDSYDADAELTLELGVEAEVPSVSSGTLSLGDVDGDGAVDAIFTVGGSTQSTFDYEERVVILPGGDYSGDLEMVEEVSHIIEPGQPYQLSWAGVTDDLDGDGSPDLVVLSSAYTSDLGDTADTGDYALEGRMDFIAALASGADTEVSLDDLIDTSAVGQESSQFGFRMVEGDFDGDGIQDLVVSGYNSTQGAQDLAGAVYFFSNAGADMIGGVQDVSAEADSWTDGSRLDGLLGYTMHNAGDVDGDGADDLLLVQPDAVSGYLGKGDIYLVSGADLSVAGLSDWEDGAIMHWRGPSTEDSTGVEIATGDFDGDGLPDLVVGEPGYAAGYGRTYVSLSSGW